MPQLEDQQVGLGDDFVDPADAADIQDIDYEPLFPVIDNFFGTMDVLAPAFPDLSTFTNAFDAASGEIEVGTNRRGGRIAIMTFQQQRLIVAALRSLGTPEATPAINRLQAAINARRALLHPR